MEDGNSNYVIYREDITEEVETASPDHDHSERRKLTRQDAVDVEFLQERLVRAPEHQRRMLQSTDIISITFLYDESVQLYSDARALATSIVINLVTILVNYKNRSILRTALLGMISITK